MARLLLALLSASSFLFLGCGSSGGSDQVAADCEDFITSDYCPAVYACGAYASVSDCITTAEAQLDCQSLHHETGLATCEADIHSAPCSELIDYYGHGAIPTSCHNVFSH
ncbi:MAG TPA: hypothetical protein VKZ18_16755 [Polyangia bacterium]|nr:hypothetical protein [Polyangia bacterium]